MKGNSIKTKKLVIISVMTAVLCVVGPVTVPIPFGPVPISLATLVMFFAVYMLGTGQAVAATALYLLIGAIGVPVFSGFTGGLSKFAGPTGGYLAGYLPMVLIAGVIIGKNIRSSKSGMLIAAAGMAAGTIVCYLLGTLWYCISCHVGFGQAMLVCVVPFLPADVVKIAVAAVFGPKLRERTCKFIM